MPHIKSQAVRVRNFECHYISAGSGEPLVLIHGWGQSVAMWSNILPELSRSFSVYALDLPGFGDSDVPREVWDVETYANFMHDFVGTLGLEQPTIVGHSFGGRIAYSYAARYPTKRLVLYSASDSSHLTIFRRLATLFSAVCAATIPKILWKLHTGALKPQTYKNVVRLSTTEIRTMLRIYDRTHARSQTTIAAITCPTALIYGSHDRIVPLSSAQRYIRRIPYASLFVIPRAGHFAHIQNTPVFLRAFFYFATFSASSNLTDKSFDTPSLPIVTP